MIGKTTSPNCVNGEMSIIPFYFVFPPISFFFFLFPSHFSLFYFFLSSYLHDSVAVLSTHTASLPLPHLHRISRRHRCSPPASHLPRGADRPWRWPTRRSLIGHGGRSRRSSTGPPQHLLLRATPSSCRTSARAAILLHGRPPSSSAPSRQPPPLVTSGRTGPTSSRPPRPCSPSVCGALPRAKVINAEAKLSEGRAKRLFSASSLVFHSRERKTWQLRP